MQNKMYESMIGIQQVEEIMAGGIRRNTDLTVHRTIIIVTKIWYCEDSVMCSHRNKNHMNCHILHFHNNKRKNIISTI